MLCIRHSVESCRYRRQKSCSQTYSLARATDYKNHRNMWWGTGVRIARGRAGSFENMRAWGAWFHQVTKKAALPKWLGSAAPRKGRRWPSICYQDGKKAWIESGPLDSPVDTIVQLLIEVADFPVSLYVCRFLCKWWAASKYSLIYEDLSSVLPPASCLPSGAGNGWV